MKKWDSDSMVMEQSKGNRGKFCRHGGLQGGIHGMKTRWGIKITPLPLLQWFSSCWPPGPLTNTFLCSFPDADAPFLYDSKKYAYGILSFDHDSSIVQSSHCIRDCTFLTRGCIFMTPQILHLPPWPPSLKNIQSLRSDDQSIMVLDNIYKCDCLI